MKFRILDRHSARLANLMSFTTTADILGFIPAYFESQSRDNTAGYQKHSAMFHVRDISTPTRVIHGLPRQSLNPIEHKMSLAKKGLCRSNAFERQRDKR